MKKYLKQQVNLFRFHIIKLLLNIKQNSNKQQKIQQFIKSTMQQQEQVFKSKKDEDWINKSRTLIITSRGITLPQKKLVIDIFNLLPHAKKQYKIEKKDLPEQIAQLCQIHKCSTFLFFQTKKRVKFSLWIGSYPQGPTMKFAINNVVSSSNLKLQGNCLKNSRHILSFDGAFQIDPVWKIAKQLFTQAMNVPLYHPKSKSVIDHTLSFSVDSKSNSLWFKNYQIFRQVVNKESNKIELYEIGPRFILEPICILDGVLKGAVLYRNQILKVFEKKKVKPIRKHNSIEGGTKLQNEFSQEQFADEE